MHKTIINIPLPQDINFQNILSQARLVFYPESKNKVILSNESNPQVSTLNLNFNQIDFDGIFSAMKLANENSKIINFEMSDNDLKAFNDINIFCNKNELKQSLDLINVGFKNIASLNSDVTELEFIKDNNKIKFCFFGGDESLGAGAAADKPIINISAIPVDREIDLVDNIIYQKKHITNQLDLDNESLKVTVGLDKNNNLIINYETLSGNLISSEQVFYPNNTYKDENLVVKSFSVHMFTQEDKSHIGILANTSLGAIYKIYNEHGFSNDLINQAEQLFEGDFDEVIFNHNEDQLELMGIQASQKDKLAEFDSFGNINVDYSLLGSKSIITADIMYEGFELASTCDYIQYDIKDYNISKQLEVDFSNFNLNDYLSQVGIEETLPEKQIYKIYITDSKQISDGSELKLFDLEFFAENPFVEDSQKSINGIAIWHEGDQWFYQGNAYGHGFKDVINFQNNNLLQISLDKYKIIDSDDSDAILKKISNANNDDILKNQISEHINFYEASGVEIHNLKNIEVDEDIRGNFTAVIYKNEDMNAEVQVFIEDDFHFTDYL